MTQRHSFQHVADDAFRALADEFGLVKSGYMDEEAGEAVVYQNASTAVRVYRDPRDREVFVQLFRVHGGKIPLHWGVDERAADPHNGYDLLDLVAIRAPGHAMLSPSYSTTVPDGASVLRILTDYAETLRQFARDVLTGDFSVFLELERIVNRRRTEERGD